MQTRSAGSTICLEVSVQPDELSAGLAKRRNICNHKRHTNDDIYCWSYGSVLLFTSVRPAESALNSQGVSHVAECSL